MPKTASIPYTEDQLQQALAAVRNGMSKKRAATVFGVPRPTIRFRLLDIRLVFFLYLYGVFLF